MSPIIMSDYYLKELIKVMKQNTFFTAGGTLLALVALIISLIALSNTHKDTYSNPEQSIEMGE